jgi:hypothetical protein
MAQVIAVFIVGIIVSIVINLLMVYFVYLSFKFIALINKGWHISRFSFLYHNIYSILLLHVVSIIILVGLHLLIIDDFIYFENFYLINLANYLLGIFLLTVLGSRKLSKKDNWLLSTYSIFTFGILVGGFGYLG